MACVSTYYSGIMATWGPGFWVITYNKAVYYTCACIILDNVDMIDISLEKILDFLDICCQECIRETQ